MEYYIFSFPSDNGKDKEFTLLEHEIPSSSLLQALISNKDRMKIGYNRRESKSRIEHVFFLSDINPDVFFYIHIFLTTGKLTCCDIDLPVILKGMDILGCNAFDYHLYFDMKDIPLEMMRITQEETWFRDRFGKKGFEYLQTDESMLVILTNDLLEQFKIITHEHLRHITHIGTTNFHGKRFILSENNKSKALYFPGYIELDINKNKDDLYIMCIDACKSMYNTTITSKVAQRLYIDEIEYYYAKYMRLRKERNEKYGDKLIESEVVYCNFNQRDPVEWSDVTQIKKAIRAWFPKKIKMNNVLIAGEFVLSRIKGGYSNKSVILPRDKVANIELFLYGLTKEKCDDKVKYLLYVLEVKSYTRTKDYITFKYVKAYYEHPPTIQIILRCYKSSAEVLMGFDVDCYGVGCRISKDDVEILMTPRAIHAFKTGMNIVNLAMSSPTYDYELVKYMQRGFAVFVPKLNKNQISNNLKRDTEEKYRSSIDNEKYKHMIKCDLIDKLNGLSYILFMSRMRLYSEFKIHSDEHESRNTHISEYKDERYDKLPMIKYSKDYNIDDEVRFMERFASAGWSIDITNSYMEAINSISYKKADEKVRSLIVPPIVNSFTIPDDLYNRYKFTIPQGIRWMTQDPSKQLTNTFNRTIITNPSSWYHSLEDTYYEDMKYEYFLHDDDLILLFNHNTEISDYELSIPDKGPEPCYDEDRYVDNIPDDKGFLLSSFNDYVSRNKLSDAEVYSDYDFSEAEYLVSDEEEDSSDEDSD